MINKSWNAECVLKCDESGFFKKKNYNAEITSQLMILKTLQKIPCLYLGWDAVQVTFQIMIISKINAAKPL